MTNYVYGIDTVLKGVKYGECELLFSNREDVELMVEIINACHKELGGTKTPAKKIVKYKNARIGKKEHQLLCSKKVKLVDNLGNTMKTCKLFSNQEMSLIKNIL